MKRDFYSLVRYAGLLAVMVALLGAAGLVIQGCGGGGGGASLPGAVTETGTLSGKITLPNGVDPSGALVVATKMNNDGTQPASALKPKAGAQLSPKADGDGTYITITDETGGYTFADIEKGSYFVMATKGAYRASHTATVEPKAATVVDLSLTPTGSIRGQVLLSGTDASGGDFSGTLALIKGTSYIAATNANGYFTISQIPVSTGYRLMFTRPGYEVKEYSPGVSVTAGQVTALNAVTMVVDSGQMGGLAGSATRPVEAGETETHEGIMVALLGTQYIAITNYDGDFEIHGIPAGTYSVAFGDLGAGVDEHHLTVDNVQIISGQVTDLDPVILSPTGIAGTVTIQGGDPAVGAMVQVQGLGSEGFAIAGTDGSYEILNIEPDTYMVAAILNGYNTAVQEGVLVKQGEITSLNFPTLVPSGTQAGAGILSGTVTVEGPPANGGTTPRVVTSIPLKHTAVQLLGTNNIAITDNQGHFTMKGVPEGTYDMFIEGDFDGLDEEKTIEGVEIIAGETTVQDTVLIDSEPPEVWGPRGIHNIAEVELDGGGTAMRVFFDEGEDVSLPITYKVYYAPAESWDYENWENNQIESVLDKDIGTPLNGDGPHFIDIEGLTPGTKYAFGVRVEDVWGNEDMEFHHILATPSGGQDIFHPKWFDRNRKGIQAAYPVQDVIGAVAVEFENATDEFDDSIPSTPPVIYMVYFATVDSWDGEDWSNNNVLEFGDGDLSAGSFYQNQAVIEDLVPGAAYAFGVRVRDSAELPNEDGNEEMRVTLPGGAEAGDPHHLMFGLAPEEVVMGQPWPGFGVTVVDADGIVVADATNIISLDLDSASNLQGLDGTLDKAAGSGTTPADTVPGTAVFLDISYSTNPNELPETIVIEATADGLIGATAEVSVLMPPPSQDVVINEIVFDPQNVWAEFSGAGGDNIKYNDHPTSSTPDEFDAYIELKNVSGDPVDFTGWIVGIADDPTSQPTFSSISSSFVYVSGGSFTGLPDSGYLVAGGIFWDTVSESVLSGCNITVFSGNPATGGQLMDSVSFGDFDDGDTSDNAPGLFSTGKSTEAVLLTLDGQRSGSDGTDYTRRFATPGKLNALIDISPPLWAGDPGILSAATGEVSGTIYITFDEEYDTASDETGLTVYYAETGSFNTSDWRQNEMIEDIDSGVSPDGEAGGFDFTITGLTPGVEYTIGIRAHDSAAPQSNEDTNTVTLTATAAAEETVTAEVWTFLEEETGIYEPTEDVWPGEVLIVVVVDEDNQANTDPDQMDTVTVSLEGLLDIEEMTLQEAEFNFDETTGIATGEPQPATDSGVFLGSILVSGTDHSNEDNDELEELPGTQIDISYSDPANAEGSQESIDYNDCLVQSPVVITEIMWPGSHRSASDQWIEIQVLSDMEMDLGGWQVENLGTLNGSGTYTIPTDTVVPPGGYLVISKYDLQGSVILDDLDSEQDVVLLTYSGLDLDKNGEQLVLTSSDGNIMDKANNSPWFAGDGTTMYSMERQQVWNSEWEEWDYTGPGTEDNIWHTCTAAINLDGVWSDGQDNHLVRSGATPGDDNSPAIAPTATKLLGLTEPPTEVESEATWDPLVFGIATDDDYIVLGATGQVTADATGSGSLSSAGGNNPAGIFSGRCWFFDVSYTTSQTETITASVSYSTFDPITVQVEVEATAQAPDGPSIVSIVADDPDDGDAVLSSGDTLTVTFSEATNEPAASSVAQINTIFNFGSNSLGEVFVGSWSDASTLLITISDPTNGALDIGDPVTIRAEGNLKNAAGTSAASTDIGIVSGDWGQVDIYDLPVPDFSFEEQDTASAFAGDGASSFWTFTSTSAVWGAAPTSGACDGTQTLKYTSVTSSETGRVVTSDFITGVSGTYYGAEMCLYSSSATFATVHAKLGIEWYDASGTLISESVQASVDKKTLTAQNAWETHSYYDDKPQGADKARVKIYLFHSGSSGIVYIDKVKFYDD